MSDSIYKALLEESWRRQLTSEEKARLQDYLRAHPEAQAEWEEEAALNFHLDRLAGAPLSSNFTARVLQAVDVEQSRGERQRSFLPFSEWSRRWIRRYLPHAASALLVLFLLAFGFQQYQVYNRKRVAESMEKLYSITAVFPKPEVFQDFEVIHQLGQVQPVNDEELIAALQ